MELDRLYEICFHLDNLKHIHKSVSDLIDEFEEYGNEQYLQERCEKLIKNLMYELEDLNEHL